MKGKKAITIEDKKRNASTQTLDYSGRGEPPNYK